MMHFKINSESFLPKKHAFSNKNTQKIIQIQTNVLQMEIMDQNVKPYLVTNEDDELSIDSNSDGDEEEFQDCDLKSLITIHLKSRNVIDDDVRHLFKRILIIDDEPFNVISMQLSLG